MAARPSGSGSGYRCSGYSPADFFFGYEVIDYLRPASYIRRMPFKNAESCVFLFEAGCYDSVASPLIGEMVSFSYVRVDSDSLSTGLVF